MSSFEEAFELTGHGIFNHLALITNGLVLLYVTVECLGLGYVLNTADCDLSLDTSERGLVGAATFIGVVSSAIIWGYLADTYGRRRVMLPATVLAVFFSVMSSLSFNFWSFVVLRMITGVLVSASCATAYVYLGELTSPSQRTASIAWGSLFIAGSYFVMPGLAWIVMPLSFSIHVTGRFSIVPWRVLMCAYTIWGTASCVGLFILPESPSFLLATKGGPASLEVLAKIYSWNKKTNVDEYPIKELIVPAVTRQTFKESISHLKYLFKPPLLKCVLITHACNFMVFMQSNSFYSWMPHVVNELLKYNPTHPHRGFCRTMNEIHENLENLVIHECEPGVDPAVYPIALVVFIPTTIVYLGIIFGIKRWGKTTVYNVIICTCSVSLLFGAYVPSNIVAIVFYVIGMCGIAANTVLAAAVVEVFPISLRALVMCTLFMVGRMGAALGMNILAWGFMHSCGVVLILMNLVAAASGLLWVFWPDKEKTRAAMEAQNFTY